MFWFSNSLQGTEKKRVNLILRSFSMNYTTKFSIILLFSLSTSAVFAMEKDSEMPKNEPKTLQWTKNQNSQWISTELDQISAPEQKGDHDLVLTATLSLQDAYKIQRSAFCNLEKQEAELKQLKETALTRNKAYLAELNRRYNAKYASVVGGNMQIESIEKEINKLTLEKKERQEETQLKQKEFDALRKLIQDTQEEITKEQPQKTSGIFSYFFRG